MFIFDVYKVFLTVRITNFVVYLSYLHIVRINFYLTALFNIIQYDVPVW